MTGHGAALVAHVLVAILGVGAVTGVVVVARRRPVDAGALGALLRTVGVSLGLMFVTGALLDWGVGGAFHDRWWFRGSVLLLLAVGGALGLARRALRAGNLARVEGLAWAMVALVGSIVVLMELKPG